MSKPTREGFLAAVRACEGIPYRWGGKDARGLDCSGLVTWALRAAGGPDLRATWNSEKLWLMLEEVAEPVAGDLAFYPGHVVVCLGGPYDRIIGANGGERNMTVAQALAKKPQACVRYAATPRYRSDFRGYRSIDQLLRRIE